MKEVKCFVIMVKEVLIKGEIFMRDWLYKARKSKGKSQDDVAKEVKISRQYYGMIENNIKTPTVPVAKKIGKVLDVNWHLFYE